jgi:hypothetical protein
MTGTMQDTGPRNWFGRNWKWLLPVGCLGILVLTVVFAALIATIILSATRSSWACTEGVELARQDPRVIVELGEPIDTGWLVTGSIRVSGPSGRAELAIPLHGPQNSATLYVVAHKQVGQWQFERAEVEVEGKAERIDLLVK